MFTRAEFLGGRARLLALDAKADTRGVLTPFAFETLPFEPRRGFFVHGVPAGTVRGGHSHQSARQLLFCVSGSINVIMSYGGERATVELCGCSEGLLIEAGVWSQQLYIKPETVLCVLASEPYSAASYRTDEYP